MTQTKDRFRIDSFSGWLGLQLENIKPINLEFGRTEVMGNGVPVQAQFIKFERLIVQLTWKVYCFGMVCFDNICFVCWLYKMIY